MKAAELRERLVEAPAELHAFAQRIMDANGAGPDEDVVREGIQFCHDLIGDCNALQGIEQTFDRGRHEVRSAAEQLRDGITGEDAEKVHAVAVARFEAFSHESTDASPRETQIVHINEAYAFPEHVHVIDVIERGESDNAVYDLEVSDGHRIRLGNARAVMDPRLWDARVVPRTKHEPPYLTPKEFRPIGLNTLRAARRDEASSTEEEQTREWLAAFRESPVSGGDAATPFDVAPLDVKLEDSERLYDLLLADQPIFGTADGRIYVRVGGLLRFVRQRLKESVTDAELRARLGRLGFRKPRNAEGKLTARLPGGDKQVSRRFLASPRDFRLEA